MIEYLYIKSALLQRFLYSYKENKSGSLFLFNLYIVSLTFGCNIPSLIYVLWSCGTFRWWRGGFILISLYVCRGGGVGRGLLLLLFCVCICAGSGSLFLLCIASRVCVCVSCQECNNFFCCCFSFGCNIPSLIYVLCSCGTFRWWRGGFILISLYVCRGGGVGRGLLLLLFCVCICAGSGSLFLLCIASRVCVCVSCQECNNFFCCCFSKEGEN